MCVKSRRRGAAGRGCVNNVSRRSIPLCDSLMNMSSSCWIYHEDDLFMQLSNCQHLLTTFFLQKILCVRVCVVGCVGFGVPCNQLEGPRAGVLRWNVAAAGDSPPPLTYMRDVVYTVRRGARLQQRWGTRRARRRRACAKLLQDGGRERVHGQARLAPAPRPPSTSTDAQRMMEKLAAASPDQSKKHCGCRSSFSSTRSMM